METHHDSDPQWQPFSPSLLISISILLDNLGFFFFNYLRFLDLKFVGEFGQLWLWVYGGSGGEFVMGVWLNLIGFVAVVFVGFW